MARAAERHALSPRVLGPALRIARARQRSRAKRTQRLVVKGGKSSSTSAETGRA
jgi:hypothetical protein